MRDIVEHLDKRMAAYSASLPSPKIKCSRNMKEMHGHFRTVSSGNVVLTIFPTQNTYHHVWKTVRTSLQCIVGLQSQGKGHEMRKTMGQICPFLFLAFHTFSLELEKNKTSKCCSESFPRMVTYILCVENCEKYI